jgi:hypothetical protein
MALQRKANFSASQPRVPAGNSDGGQWTSDGQDAGARADNGPKTTDSRIISDVSDAPRPGAQYAEAKIPGIGHNNAPPDVPERRPSDVRERNRIAREVARYSGPIALIYRFREWLRELGPSIDSYWDPPKSLEELQAAAFDLPKPGYQRHHIVEQTPARKDASFSEDWIEDRSNIVAVPTYKHEDITAWFSKINYDPRFGGLSPREYLRNKDWSERLEVGLEALRKFGVLKP